MTQEEIREICESHEIDPRDAMLFNDEYILSRTGDIICGPNWGYSIWDNQLRNHIWFSHLSMKKWYNADLFVPAYIEALCRHNIEEVVCQLDFCKFVTIHPFEYRNNSKRLSELSYLVSAHGERLELLLDEKKVW